MGFIMINLVLNKCIAIIILKLGVIIITNSLHLQAINLHIKFKVDIYNITTTIITTTNMVITITK